MKKLSIYFLAFASLSMFAAEPNLFYASGKLKGKKVKNTSFLGYEETCYEGNPWEVRKLLKEMASDDIEKKNVKVWFNQESTNIQFTYIDTKCTDEGESSKECTNVIEITNCLNR